jgi:hypothetical protein
LDGNETLNAYEFRHVVNGVRCPLDTARLSDEVLI